MARAFPCLPAPVGHGRVMAGRIAVRRHRRRPRRPHDSDHRRPARNSAQWRAHGCPGLAGGTRDPPGDSPSDQHFVAREHACGRRDCGGTEGRRTVAVAGWARRTSEHGSGARPGGVPRHGDEHRRPDGGVGARSRCARRAVRCGPGAARAAMVSWSFGRSIRRASRDPRRDVDASLRDPRPSTRLPAALQHLRRVGRGALRPLHPRPRAVRCQQHREHPVAGHAREPAFPGVP